MALPLLLLSYYNGPLEKRWPSLVQFFFLAAFLTSNPRYVAALSASFCCFCQIGPWLLKFSTSPMSSLRLCKPREGLPDFIKRGAINACIACSDPTPTRRLCGIFVWSLNCSFQICSARKRSGSVRGERDCFTSRRC